MSPLRNRIFGSLGTFHSYEDERLSRTKIRFTSNFVKAWARLEPMAPAPPVTRMLLRRKASEGSSTSNRHPVLAPHPFHRPSNPLLRRDFRVVLQVPDRFGTVHRLRFRGERLSILVGDQGVVAAHGLQDEG